VKKWLRFGPKELLGQARTKLDGADSEKKDFYRGVCLVLEGAISFIRRYRIAKVQAPGDTEAACKAFVEMGYVIGDAIANVACLIDGLVVIGGGISAAAELFMPTIMEELNGQIGHLYDVQLPRMPFRAYYLEDDAAVKVFSKGDQRVITVPQSSKRISYDSLPRIGVGLSTLGVGRATAMGA